MKNCLKKFVVCVFGIIASITPVSSVTNLHHGVTCENQNLQLSCGAGGVVNVLDAIYGRTNLITCMTGSTGNVTCRAKHSLDIAGELCDGKSSCEIVASNDVFGDPCPGTHKYLMVIYECALEESIKTATACEHHSVALECPPKEIIHVLEANYGRVNREICGGNTNNRCFTPNALDIVSRRCNNRRVCAMTASNSIFQDPCHGVIKYLNVKYECNAAVLCADTRGARGFHCHDNNVIHPSLVCNGIKDCSDGDDEFVCEYDSVYVCENSNKHLKCDDGKKLKIINANYGRLSTKICPTENVDQVDCKSSNAMKIIENLCGGKTECQIPSSNTVFGDPCSGVYKYTEVHYECFAETGPHSINPRSV